LTREAGRRQRCYYVSHDKRDLVANIVDTKQPDTERLVFIHN
jgi:hypothetical protein